MVLLWYTSLTEKHIIHVIFKCESYMIWFSSFSISFYERQQKILKFDSWVELLVSTETECTAKYWVINYQNSCFVIVIPVVHFSYNERCCAIMMLLQSYLYWIATRSVLNPEETREAAIKDPFGETSETIISSDMQSIETIGWSSALHGVEVDFETLQKQNANFFWFLCYQNISMSYTANMQSLSKTKTMQKAPLEGMWVIVVCTYQWNDSDSEHCWELTVTIFMNNSSGSIWKVLAITSGVNTYPLAAHSTANDDTFSSTDFWASTMTDSYKNETTSTLHSPNLM